MRNCLSKGLHVLLLSSFFFASSYLSGCSFHSNQWTAIKSLLEARKVEMPEPWRLSMGVNNISVYPIQMDASILFTDGEKVFIKFDGWHIVEVRGVGQFNAERSSVHTSRLMLDYAPDGADLDSKFAEGDAALASEADSVKGAVVYQVRCADWIRSDNAAGEFFTQSCKFHSDKAFFNSIQLDQSGNIVTVETVAGPDRINIRLAATGY